jgi:hypothetical protein
MAEQQAPKTPPEPVHQPGTGKGEEKVNTETKEAGRKDTGTQGGAKRPSGASTGRDSSAVSPSKPIDPESPNIPTP